MTSLDDLNARLWTLKDELRRYEGARDDALKSADDRTAKLPREGYLEDAASLEFDIAKLRAEIADLEAQRRLLRRN